MNNFYADRAQHRGVLSLGIALMFVGCVVTSGVATAAPMLRVALHPQAQARYTTVVLDDVAALRSTDLTLLRKAMALPLGRAPRLGESSTLEREALQLWLRSQIGLTADQIVWEGADSTVVRAASQEISGEKLATTAELALRQHIEKSLSAKHSSGGSAQSAEDYRVELSPLAVPVGILVPAASSQLKARSLERTPISNRMVVWIEIWAEGRHIRTVPMRYEVSVFTFAPVASTSVKVGMTLSPDSLTLRETDIARLLAGSTVAAWPQDANGATAEQRLRRKLERGEVVTAAHVQAPAVSRGEWVSVVARSGTVSLESRAEVLQDAGVGELVRIKPLKATTSLLARVVGPGRLVLEP